MINENKRTAHKGTHMDKDTFRETRQIHIGSQARAAELLGVSIRAIGRYESGETEIPPPVALIMDMIEADPTTIETIIELSKLD